jgi:hypothetical protein
MHMNTHVYARTNTPYPGQWLPCASVWVAGHAGDEKRTVVHPRGDAGGGKVGKLVGLQAQRPCATVKGVL